MAYQNNFIKTRAGKFGPESDLVERILSTDLKEHWGRDALVLREPALPTGFPDILFAYPSQCRIGFFCTTTMSEKHARFLHHVYQRNSVPVNSFVTDLLWNVTDARQVMRDLESCGSIRMESGMIFPMDIENVFMLETIVAIEAKMRDWRSAIKQAISNTWFASLSYVMLPANKNIDVALSVAREFGIGVIVVDGGWTVLLEAKRHELPASYGSWVINEWAIRQMSSDNYACT